MHQFPCVHLLTVSMLMFWRLAFCISSLLCLVVFPSILTSVRVDVGIVLLRLTFHHSSGRQWSFSLRSKFFNKLGHAGLTFEVIYVEVFSERWFCIIHKAWIDGVMSRLLVSKRKMVAEIKDPGNLGESYLREKRLLGRGLTELHLLELA